MAGDGKSIVGTILCGVVLVIGLNVFLWSKFASDLNFYRQQRPALCVDGRRMGEPLLNSRLGVDDSKRNKGLVTMQCSIPVAVYPCYDEDIEADAWNGQCRSLAQLPAFTEDKWPRRMPEPGITCCERDCVGSDKCSNAEWDCSSGKCTAYDKSTRLCAAMMHAGNYPCFTVEGDPEAGIREEASNFPVGFLIGGICAAVLFLVCCFGSVGLMSEEENCVGKALAFIVTICICVGIMLLIGVIVRAAQGPADDKGVVDSNYKDLAVQSGSVNFGTNQTAIAAEAPPPEGMHWGIVLLIVFGSIYGVICLLGACMFCLHCCKEVGWSARAKAVESSQRAGASDAPQKQFSNVSVFSGRSNRDVVKGMSREDVHTAVKTAPGMTRADVIGHRVLTSAEDTRAVVKGIWKPSSQPPSQV